jgi:hypothetical protein
LSLPSPSCPSQSSLRASAALASAFYHLVAPVEERYGEEFDLLYRREATEDDVAGGSFTSCTPDHVGHFTFRHLDRFGTGIKRGSTARLLQAESDNDTDIRGYADYPEIEETLLVVGLTKDEGRVRGDRIKGAQSNESLKSKSFVSTPATAGTAHNRS